MEKLRSIIGFLRMLAILFLCNAGLGFLVFAEGVELLSIAGTRNRPGDCTCSSTGRFALASHKAATRSCR